MLLGMAFYNFNNRKEDSMNKGYILGLDIGVTSVGWGIIDQDHEIVDAGVRLFEEANASMNEKRREKRHARRVKRRKTQRIIEMKRHLLRHNIIGEGFKPMGNPYELRVKGLKEKLEDEEMATALLHLVKRRGSTLDTVDVTEDKEELKSKEQLSINTKKLKDEHKHVSEVQLERYNERKSIRGEDNIFKTEDYIAETTAILNTQDKSEAFNEKVIELISRKRHYSDGPGSKDSPSPYGKFRLNEEGEVEEVNLIEEMRGHCSVYKDELRAPLESFSAELFNFLNDLNNLKIIHREEEKLTVNEKETIIDKIREKGYLSPKAKPHEAIAKILNIEPETLSGFRINTKKNPIITEFKGYQKLLKVFNKHEESLIGKDKILDTISEILTSHKKPSERIEAFESLGLNELLIKDLSNLPGFEKYHSMSFKAIYEITLELLETTKNQMEIITENNLVVPEAPNKLTLDENLILSPIAKRAHRESLRVIERLTHKYGDFDKIVIETTRAKNTKEEKDDIKKLQKIREQRNEEVQELLKGYGEQANRIKGKKALKIRLYKQQDGKCAYTHNPLSLDAIVNNRDSYEIDHVLPYSVSMDNSLNNQVLCEHKANQIKGNKTPYIYFKSGQAYGEVKTFEAFKTLVLSNTKYPRRKKELLLKEEDITRFDVMQEFTERNLVDTSYAIRSLMRTLKSFYKYHEKPTKVFTVRGKVTNLYRNRAKGLFAYDHPDADFNPMEKDRSQYRHHAIDALIAARLSEQKLIKELMYMDRTKKVDIDTGEILEDDNPMFDEKLIRFLKQLSKVDDSDLKFSWKVDKKPNRPFSDETIYSTRTVNDKEWVVKKHKDIYSMESKDIKKKLIDKAKKVNLLVYKHDPKSYEKLVKAYEQYSQEKYPFAVFKDNHGYITKYSKKGNGPELKQLKYLDGKLGNHTSITHNYNSPDKKVVLLQISPYRTDFYKNADGTIKFVTVRRKDLKPINNNKQFVMDETLYEQKKLEKGITKDAAFINSFNRNEIIEITSKDKEGVKKKQYRFIATNNDTLNSIEVKPISSESLKPQIMLTIGRKTLDITKYAVSPIGEMSKIEKESLKLVVNA